MSALDLVIAIAVLACAAWLLVRALRRGGCAGCSGAGCGRGGGGGGGGAPPGLVRLGGRPPAQRDR